LIAIYQSERDWAKAIENATRYEAVTGEPMGKLVAQFECELADRHRAAGRIDEARAAIARAYAADCTSVRAGLLEGRIEVEAGNDTAAIRAFERAARHDPDYLPELLPSLLAAYARVGDTTGARTFLAQMAEHYRGISPVLALTRLVEVEEGVGSARAYLAQQLKDRPSVRGEAALINLTLAESADPVATLHDLKHITDQLLVRNPSYRCSRCGFGARSHHWQCPRCQAWGTVKPLLHYAVGWTCRCWPGACWGLRSRWPGPGWRGPTRCAMRCSTTPANVAATRRRRRAAAASRSSRRCSRCSPGWHGNRAPRRAHGCGSAWAWSRWPASA